MCSTPLVARYATRSANLNALAESLLEVGLRVRAQAGDLRSLYALLEEASAWLRAKGVAQWNPVYPIERFARDIEAGHVWYWKTGAEAVATVTVLPHRPDYYPAGLWEDDVPAWYVCRLVVTRKLAGRRVGEQLLNELEADAACAGIRALRLDVTAANPFLERYYLARGFLDRGQAEIKRDRSLILERPVGAKPA